MIVYRATVEGVTSVDVAMKVVPAADGEDPICAKVGDGIIVNVPGAANGDDVGEVLRAFGRVIGIAGAVRIVIEVDAASPPLSPTEDTSRGRRKEE
jgi:hypothetical protein